MYNENKVMIYRYYIILWSKRVESKEKGNNGWEWGWFARKETHT